MTSGVRQVERDDDGRPTVVTVEATDAEGRTIRARGETVSRQVLQTYPSMFCWNSLVRWDTAEWTGWGEDQDVWHPRRWRDFKRSSTGRQ